MTTELLFAAAVIVLVTGAGGGVWHLRTRGSRNAARAAPTRRVEVPADEHSFALERIKSAVHDLLHGLSGSLDTMQGDSHRYGRALAEHRESLEGMATIEDLRELERRLLDQVKEVQGANDLYRRELDAANRKVAEQQQELVKFQRAAGVDFLTELPNRRQLDERMREEFGRAKRYGHLFSIVVFDLDHFKRINDELGHAAGDRVLRALAQLLYDQKRSSDFLARYGGEEFVMLLPETPLENAARLATKVCDRVRETEFQFQKQVVRITLSAGVGAVVPGVDTAESLFDRVDAALYEAKRLGRDRVCKSPPPTAHA